MSAHNDREFIDFLLNKEKGGKAMKCPLLQVAWVVNGKTESHEVFDCLKEECAWWFEATQECAIKELAHILSGASSTLREIENKMPHEEQFRK